MTTATEEARALALARCGFPIASFSKRFARELAEQVNTRREITERQSARLAIQCFIYRRQLPAALAACVRAGEIAEVPADAVPATPPPGYATPSQRYDAARLEMERRRAAQAVDTASRPTLEPDFFQT